MPPPRRDGSPPRQPTRKLLTEFDVRRTKPETSVFQVWDTKCKGLCLRIQPTGFKSFFVWYGRDGRRGWYHIGDAGRISLSDAREIAAEISLRVIKGEDPVSDRRAQRGQDTLG